MPKNKITKNSYGGVAYNNIFEVEAKSKEKHNFRRRARNPVDNKIDVCSHGHKCRTFFHISEHVIVRNLWQKQISLFVTIHMALLIVNKLFFYIYRNEKKSY